MKKHDYRAHELTEKLRGLRCASHDEPINGLRTNVFENGSFEARWDHVCCDDMRRRAGAIVDSQFDRCNRRLEVLRMRNGRTQIELNGLTKSGETRDAARDHEGLEGWRGEYTCVSCGETFIVDELRAPRGV